jgi:hypothetical protein
LGVETVAYKGLLPALLQGTREMERPISAHSILSIDDRQTKLITVVLDLLAKNFPKKIQIFLAS